MTYQRASGTLSPGAHPGSYNGQDAYNNLLITGGFDEMPMGRNADCSNAVCKERGGAQRMPDKMNFNAVIDEPTFMSDRKGHNGITEDGTATTLTAQEKERPLTATSVVRRLTPVECERLQGFPDEWSRYGINEKGEVYELSDSARYKLQGNSIARPFWTWLMRRIAAQYETQPTLGSLFDGQAGFPLCGLEAGIRTLWTSEIEKHAVAVVRYHFGDKDMNIEGDWRQHL